MDRPPSTGNSPTSLQTDRTFDLGTGRTACIAGAVSLAAAIALGAFGAHAIEAALPADRLDAYQTASQYHFYSCFFLFVLALTRSVIGRGSLTGRGDATTDARLAQAQACWGWGTLVFCGSVYLVSVRGLIGMETASWLGAIAPIGGTLLIVGAGLAAWAILKHDA